jgi:pimeloyl-ACP methyl ester carboxylesterase
MSGSGVNIPEPSQQRRLPVNGLKLNVIEWGSATGEPIVMLHGLRGDARTWSRTADVLAGRYRLIGLDQRGRGLSDWGTTRDYFTPAYVADLKRVVDILELPSFILLGHSMGGATSLAFAQAYPQRVKALILEDIGPGSSASSEGADRIRRELTTTPYTFASRAAALAFWRESRPTASERSIQERVANTMIEQPDGSVTWRIDFAGIAEARLNTDPAKIIDLWPSVKSLSCPTLAMRGAKSDFLSKETLTAMAEANGRISAREISGASHYVHDDNFEEFIGTVNEFLDRIASAGSGDLRRGMTDNERAKT